MAFIVIEIDSSDTVGQLNDLLRASGNPKEGAQLLHNYLNQAICQKIDATLNVAVRSTTASVAASGGGNSVIYQIK